MSAAWSPVNCIFPMSSTPTRNYGSLIQPYTCDEAIYPSTRTRHTDELWRTAKALFALHPPHLDYLSRYLSDKRNKVSHLLSGAPPNFPRSHGDRPSLSPNFLDTFSDASHGHAISGVLPPPACATLLVKSNPFTVTQGSPSPSIQVTSLPLPAILLNRTLMLHSAQLSPSS